MAPTSPCRPSLLLASSSTGLLARRAKSAKARSIGVSPARASITNIRASASLIAVSVCSCIRAVSEPLAPSSSPAVSITVNSRSPSRPLPSRRSRVTPGSLSTSASFCPTSRLNSVDFPTLGRPIMAIVKDINNPNALFRRACQSNEKENLTRESAAWHRGRERRGGLLRGRRRGRLRGRLIGRRRGGALAGDLLGLGRRRRGGGAALFLRRGIGTGSGGLSRRRCGGGGRSLLALGFRGALRFRLLRRWRGGGRSLSVWIDDLLLTRALVEFLR